LIKKYTYFYLLLFLVFLTSLIFTKDSFDNLAKMKDEAKEEANYIYNDATLTTEFHLNKLSSQLELKLNNIKTNEDLEKIKEEYPEIISITLEKNFLQDNNPLSKYELIIPLTSSSNNESYLVKIKPDIFSEIEKKQQLRMYTVTHLQNNRWKTTPTIYIPNISLSIDERLPNLKPDAETKGVSHYIEKEVVIKFKENVTEEFIQAFLLKYDLLSVKRRDHAIIIKSLNYDIKDLIKILEDKNNKDNKIIEYVEPHFVYLSNNLGENFTPNDILYSEYQWNLPSILVEKGWSTTRGKDEVIIAVVDTGIDLDHPEFKDKLTEGYNVLKPNLPPMDDDGHGTHVSGIISANTNNQEGIAGITWYNKIMPIKVLDQSGAGTLFDVAEGIYWATEHGAKVINLSLGNYAESKYLLDAVKYAYSKDVVLVAASGNDDIDELGYPAAYPEVIAVAALDSLKAKAGFSNFGPYIDVSAPGVNIASTYPNNEYAAMSGTSMASPHVAGLAGLIRAINPDLTNKEVADIIKNTSTDIGPAGKDAYFGYGEINVEEALNNSGNIKVQQNSFLKWIIEVFSL